MSYNRGNMRRDGGRRSNDFGSGGNRRGGGGGYMNNYDNYNSQMNPWEGGMVPGRSGGGGLLPSTGQGDLLSQLTSPEAQLALASNLINKLINQQQQSVPSLLNIGNLGSSGGHMSSFHDGYGNTRNFQDRRRGRMDQRRTEPYNKSGMNRRMGTDRRNLGKNRMGSDRRASVSKSPKVQKDDKDKKDKDAEKSNGEVKSESADDSKREEREGSEAGDDGEKKKKDKAAPLPAALLYCHVCSKNMWDETSFVKHLKGRLHQLMMDGLNEKYKLKVDLLRHEMRLAEQQREMEIDRKQRQGIKVYNHPREYCAMCDLHFYGHLISHRKNIRHQKLKAFLHPKCSHCNKEFSTRLEWDDHRLSFPHLEKVADFRRATKPDIKDDEFDIDELVCPDSVNCGDMISKEVPVMVRHQSEEDVTADMKEEPLKEREDIKKEAKDDGEGQADDSITDETKEKDETKEIEAPQGIDVDPSKLPKYNSAVVIGKDLVIPMSGYMCRVCNRFMQGDDEMQIHCRTLTHYNHYCNIVRAKARISGRRKRTDGKSKGDKNEEDRGDDDKVHDEKDDDDKAGDEKTDPSVDDEGNWKRRKTNENAADESMEVDDKIEKDVKDEIPDSVWEEVDKEADSVSSEGQKEEEESVEEETESSPAPRNQRATRGGPRGRRGGKRGK